MKSASIDLLIVGQGLAGSALAMRALMRGLRVLVIDDPSANRSSSVAAGLFNPITGRKMSKTWMADSLFPVLHDYYRSIEALTGSRFFHPTTMYRPFLNIEEQNEWMGASAEPAYGNYVGAIHTSPAYGSAVNDPYGGIVLSRAGYLDTRGYLNAVASFLLKQSAYVKRWFDAGDLVLSADQVRYHDWKARKVVFCQGVHNASNPWFGDLPINPLKGEFISVQCDWPVDVILNRGVYMVPGGEATWRVGATYNRHDLSPETTEQARAELTDKLDNLIRLPYEVQGQQWGLRPTTPDRKPILGAHPQHPSLIVFNGLGTKGVSMAPYFSEVLIRWLENEGQITKEADISRFK